jgi:hypothetical protein
VDVIEKVRSADLRSDVASARSEPRVVIVELDMPKARVEVIRPEQHDDFGSRARFRLGATTPAGEAVERRISNARGEIERIIGRPADRFFRSSNSFVVEANGEQIGRLAELPSVAAIWPNLGGHRGAT